ncbi:MAG: molybdopterin-binding protein, partial [Clostridia bacterium]
MFVAAVLTVSDRSFAGVRPDAAGPAVREMLEQAGYALLPYALVPDEQETIQAELCRLADAEGAALIETTTQTHKTPQKQTPKHKKTK